MIISYYQAYIYNRRYAISDSPHSQMDMSVLALIKPFKADGSDFGLSHLLLKGSFGNCQFDSVLYVREKMLHGLCLKHTYQN